MDYDEWNKWETDPISLPDSMPCLIEIPSDSEINEEFQILINRVNHMLKQTEFDIDNGEFIYKEHCNELRRQVQLAKETQIQKIEEITDKLMNEIDEFEKESLETVSKVNKEQLVNKLNEMKQENQKWNERLDEFKVDNQMLNQLRDSLSKIAFERDNFKCLLHNKMMKFKEYKDQSLVGELSQVSLNSLDQIFLKKQIRELEKRYLLKDDVSGLSVSMVFEFRDDDTGLPIPIYFEFREGKILSNGDLLLYGEIRDENADFHDVVLAVFDSNKDFKLKKIKQLCVYSEKMATSFGKICLTYQIKDKSDRYRARKETEDDKEYQKTNSKADDYMVLILNENLEKLNLFKSHEMNLIGANDSYLFFAYDTEHEYGRLSFYTWSMEFVKTIGQSNDPNLPFYFSFCNVCSFRKRKLVNLFGKYYYLGQGNNLMIDETVRFIIIDEETGILLKSFEAYDFCFDNSYNIILSYEHSIKYLSFNGDFLKEIQTNEIEPDLLLNNDKLSIASFDDKYSQLCFWNKYDEDTHEVV